LLLRQPRLENSPQLRDVIRLTYTSVDVLMEPASITLDIDDTCDPRPSSTLAVQSSLWERYFLPIHVYDTGKELARGL